MNNINIKDYDIDQYGKDEDTSLINNSYIINVETQKHLTIDEIKKLKLFVNPLDAAVFSFQNGVFTRDERFEYESY